MKKYIIFLIILLAGNSFAIKLPPTAIGYVLFNSNSGLVTVSGELSHDNDDQNGENQSYFAWNFDYHGSFENGIEYSNSTVTTHQYLLPGMYTVAIRYYDNDGQESPIYTFTVTVSFGSWKKKCTYGTDAGNIDERGQLIKVEVCNGSTGVVDVTESFVHNEYGRIASVSLQMPSLEGNTPQVTSYTYNQDGNIKSLNYGSMLSVTYSYDRMGRVVNIGTATDEDFFAAYEYMNENGALSAERINNGTISSIYAYNQHGWLTSIVTGWPSNVSNNRFVETLDYHSDGYQGAGYYNGNIARISVRTSFNPSTYDFRTEYKYDNLGRLLTASNVTGLLGSLAPYDLGVGTEQKYDANDNILANKEGSITRNYTYIPGTAKLKNTTGNTAVEFQYDNNGNVLSSNVKSLVISYDPYFNSTSTILDANSEATKFMYSATGERVYRQTLSGTPERTYYIRGLNEFPLVEKDNGSPSTRLYVYGKNGLIAVQDNNNWYFTVRDHLGSTRVLLDQQNIPVTRYHYSPYGRTMWAYVNHSPKYRFTGQEFDEQTGLYNFRARMYDPETGIFYGADPAGQGYAAYAYCGNNPVMMIDKDGRFFWIAAAAIIGGAMNTVAHLDKIHSATDFAVAFGIGAAAGAATALTFGAALPGAAVVGAEACVALGSGGFMAGLGAGALSGAYGSLIQTMGNVAYFKDPMPSVKDFALQIGINSLTGGISNGLAAQASGASFWTGDIPLPAPPSGGSFTPIQLDGIPGSSSKNPFKVDTYDFDAHSIPNKGAIKGTEETINLKIGDRFSRYGKPTSESVYLTIPNAEIGSIGIPPNRSTDVVFNYEVLKPFSVVRSKCTYIQLPDGTILGGGDQFVTPDAIVTLRDNGFLREWIKKK